MAEQNNLPAVDESVLKIVTLAQIKAQLRIDIADTIQDQRLVDLAESVEDLAFNEMERSYDSLIVEYGKVPRSIRMAVLDRITSEYTSPNDETEIKRGTSVVVRPYRWQSILLKFKPTNKI